MQIKWIILLVVLGVLTLAGVVYVIRYPREVERILRLGGSEQIETDEDELALAEQARTVVAGKYTVEQAMQNYPRYFTGVPKELYQAIVDYAEKLAPGFAQSKLEEYYLSKPSIRKFRWKAIGKYLGYTAKALRGYVLFLGHANNMLLGKRREVDLWLYKSIMKDEGSSDAEKEKISKQMVKEYEFYLFPKSIMSRTNILITLIRALRDDPELRELLYAFEIAYESKSEDLLGNPIFPVIIYPTAGKEKAQKALDKIYALFKHVPASGQRLAYSAQVNDLISVKQGSDVDRVEKYKKFFQAPEYVYYNPELTGIQGNYRLINPATGKELIGEKPEDVKPAPAKAEKKPITYTKNAVIGLLNRLKGLYQYDQVKEYVMQAIAALKEHGYTGLALGKAHSTLRAMREREMQLVEFVESGESRQLLEHIEKILLQEERRLAAEHKG